MLIAVLLLMILSVRLKKDMTKEYLWIIADLFYDIRLKLDYPPYILENPLGKVVNPSGRTLAKAFPDKALRCIASDILMALYNVDNIEQLHERLKILVGKFNSKKCKYQLDLSIDQTSTGDNAEYISHVEALKYASVDQLEDPVREIISH